MKMVAIANPKGGSGTTETSIYLAGELSLRGFKVLLLDFSSLQDSFNRLLNIPPYMETIGFDLYNEGTNIKDALYEIQENLDIAKCSQDFMYDIYSEYIKTHKSKGFRNIFKDIEADYDYCIADLNSSFDAFFIDSILTSDAIIIPVSIEGDNLHSFSVLNQICSAIRSEESAWYNPDFEVAGVLVTRWLEDSENDADILKTINAYAQILETKIYRTKIRYSWTVKKAKQQGVFLGAYAPNANVTEDYNIFVDEFLEDDGKDNNDDDNDDNNIVKTNEASVLDDSNKARKVSLCISLSKEQNVAIVTLSVKIGISYTEMITRILKKGFELVAQTKGFEYRNNSKIYLTKPVWVPKDIKDQLENISLEERLDKTYIIRCLIDLVIETNAV